MSELSPPLTEAARKSFSLILRRLASVGQAAVSRQLGVSESAISRMKSEGDLEEFSAFLDALGLKVVPVDHQVYRAAFIRSLIELAGERLDVLRLDPDAGAVSE